jgi:hypothetical protein
MTSVRRVFPIWRRRDWHNLKPLCSEDRREAEYDLPFFLCAEHVRQLGGASPLHNVMDVK